MNKCLPIALILLLIGCASTHSDFERLSALPTPTVWEQPSTWTFAISNSEDELVGTLTLELLDAPAETCGGEGWRLARPVVANLDNPPLNDWYSEDNKTSALYPAYRIEGKYLWLVLNAPICDNDWTMRGELSEFGATGRFRTEGMFGGEEIGTFIAVRSGG